MQETHPHIYIQPRRWGQNPDHSIFGNESRQKMNEHQLPKIKSLLLSFSCVPQLNSLHIFCVSCCSWHEMGTKDLPRVIDYILQTTGADQIFYVGHSQGTTMFYVLCSELPEYNSKIRAMFSLAPIAFLENVRSPLLQMTATIGDLMWVSCQRM